MNNELNTRQWNLYNFLKDNNDRYFTQCEIASIFTKDYPYDFKQPFHDSNARHLMTSDIRAINDSAVIQKIIISTPKGIKLATKEEFDKYINCQYAKVFRMLKRIRLKDKKASLDGQGRMVFGKERDTIEAFIGSYLEQEK